MNLLAKIMNLVLGMMNLVLKRMNFASKMIGVVCYMDELFDAPDVVKWVLNDDKNLHKIAYGGVRAEQVPPSTDLSIAGMYY